MAKPKKNSRRPTMPTDAPPLNTPFAAARAQLIELMKPAKAAKAPPAPAPPPPPQPAPSSDEDLFRQEMHGVQPLEQDSGRVVLPVPQDRLVSPQRSEEAEAYAQLSDLVTGQGPFDITDTDEYMEGIAPGLDRRLLLRLRRGDYAIQAHLDLHGLVRQDAHLRVEQFIHESRLRGRRCVLIVHGRGLNSKDQIPVLKEGVRVWLSRGRISRSVLCFATARPTDGGAGAVYVLLRR